MESVGVEIGSGLIGAAVTMAAVYLLRWSLGRRNTCSDAHPHLLVTTARRGRAHMCITEDAARLVAVQRYRWQRDRGAVAYRRSHQGNGEPL